MNVPIIMLLTDNKDYVKEICTRHRVRTQLYYQKWYTKYQLHVSAIILSIIGCTQLYKVTIQYM